MQSNLPFMVLIIIIFVALTMLIVAAISTKKKQGVDQVIVNNTEASKSNTTERVVFIFSILVTILPIFPLTILSSVSAVGSGLSGEIVSLWFLGGPIGFIALIRAFFNLKTKLDFWILLYGGLAYSSLALLTIFDPYKEYKDYTMLIIAIKIYITMSLIVFPWYLVKCYKHVFMK